MAGKIHDEQLKVDIIINGNDAQKKLGKLQTAKRNLKRENDDLRKAKARLVAQGKKETKEFKRLTKQLSLNNIEIKENESKQKELRKELGLTGLTTRQLRSEQKRLKAVMSGFIPGTDKWREYNAELQKVDARLAEVRAEMKGVQDVMNKSGVKTGFFSKVKDSLKSIGPLVLSAFSIGAVIAFFKAITSQIGVLKELKSTLSWFSNTQGDELNRVTARVEALSKAFKKDTSKMSESANNLSKQMNISFDKALDVIEKGLYDGADAHGELLDKVREYPPLLKEVGLSADESIALMTQEIKQGIYSDKGVDAIKEANIRLREMPKSTVGALNALGLSSKKIQKEITDGSKTTFDVIQLVSKRMASLPPQSKLVGQAIADVFGGPGEDAGYKYLANLHKIDLSMKSMVSHSDDWSRAKRVEVQANEALNNVLVKLTGTGSTLSLIYNSFKLGMSELLGTITGLRDTAHEASIAFDSQADAVIKLDKNLLPLIEEYDNLKKEASLTTTEQDRLKQVISKIGSIVPTAITAFDDYGNALDISSTKAKEFITTQKTLLRYKNAKVIKEQTEELRKLNKEHENNKSILSNRNSEGDIVKKTQAFTRGGNIILGEKDVSPEIIAKLQARQAEIQELKKEHQIILDAHNGDYLEKAIKKQNEETKQTDDQIAARKILEETAAKYRIKNIKNLSDKQLQLEIQSAIARANKLSGINVKKRKEEQKANQKRLELLKKFREELLFSAMSHVEKEKQHHKNRLKQAGVFGKSLADLTKKEIQVKELLEKQHQAKIAKIELNAFNDFLAKKKKGYADQKLKREIEFNERLFSINSFEEAKSLLRDKLSEEEFNKLSSLEDAKKVLKRKHEAEELNKQSEYLNSLVKLYKTALSTGDVEGINLVDGILTEEQKEAVNAKLEEVRKKISELNLAKKKLTNPKEDSELKSLDDVDIFGSSPEQWDTVFGNLDTTAEKIEALSTVLKGLQQAWGMYNQFVTASEQKQLQKLERSNNDKKKSLQKQLDDGLISQEQYNNEIEKLDNSLAKKKAEIEYKQAKREQTAALFNIVANTALGIMKAVSSFPLTGGMPWTAIIASVGALQAGLVLSSPLPSPGFEDGLYPVTRNDGKKFNAKLGRTHTGLVTQPTLMDGSYLAGERSTERNPEMIIDDVTFSKLDPRIPEYIMAVHNGTVSGFEKGKYETSFSNDVVGFEAENQDATEELRSNSVVIDLLSRIAIATEKGNVLVIGYEEARKINDLQNELVASKQNGNLV
ncbi:phage tail tape measure protein [Tenacibaculum halocynthiae]|uniref:phage tail tape measure protein n=1 Tax=Tenacibaculum halocynthiae TaxID=1254437 RepID=UPI00389379C2